MKRIALLVPGMSHGGGVPTVARFLYQVLKKSQRYDVEVISLATAARDRNSIRLLSPRSWGAGLQWSDEQWQDIAYRHLGAVLTEFEFQRYRPRRELTEALRSFDLVQVVAGAPAWTLAAADFKGPVVLQVATLSRTERALSNNGSHSPRRLWSKAMTAITSRLELCALERADAICVENHWMLQHLRSKLPSEKVRFAPPGVDTDFFQPGAYQPDGPILWVGRFSDSRKNLPLLLEAYAILRTLNSHSPKLVLAGWTEPPQHVLALAQSLGITPHLEIHCDASPDQLRQLYGQASLFVLSSNEEGLGIVILEAMASGLPVISTDCGGPKTTVTDGETGLLTPVGDVRTLVNKMQHLVGDSALRARMGLAGHRVVKDRFSLESTGNNYLEIYDSLLSAK